MTSSTQYSFKESRKRLLNLRSILNNMLQNHSPIFVAENSLVARRIYSIFLKPLAREVRYFENLQECVMGFQQTEPAAIITSVNLPFGPEEGEPLSGGLVLLAWLKKKLDFLKEEVRGSSSVKQLLRTPPPENLSTFVFSSSTDQTTVDQIHRLEPCAYFEKSRFFNMDSQTYVIDCMQKSLREKGQLI